MPDLHGNDLYGYVAQTGGWRRLYSDLLREHLVDPATGAYAGIDYRTWEIGTPSTNP